MADYFKVSNGAIVSGPTPKRGIRDPHVSISLNTDDATLKRLGWLPQVRVGDDPIDSATQVKTGPVHTVGANAVTSTWTIRDKTAQDIDAERTARATSVVDGEAFRAAVEAIAAVQESLGRPITTADVPAVRQAAMDAVKARANGVR